MGVNDTVALDILKGKTNSGDLFLLCSDGLSDMVEATVLWSILTGQGSLHEKVAVLIDQAKEAGGKDNVTVVLSAVD